MHTAEHSEKKGPSKADLPSREADAQCDFYATATTESFRTASKAKSAQKNEVENPHLFLCCCWLFGVVLVAQEVLTGLGSDVTKDSSRSKCGTINLKN